MTVSLNKRDIAIVAITKKGMEIAKKLKNAFDVADIFAPSKFQNPDPSITYFQEPVTQKIGYLFSNYNSLILIFSLGAVVRLVAPYLKDKKTDPAVVVIDDAAKFVISTLSGHLGGANELALQISDFLKSIPVVTTAADVNKTISVDLIGNKLGWAIDNYENVTSLTSGSCAGTGFGGAGVAAAVCDAPAFAGVAASVAVLEHPHTTTATMSGKTRINKLLSW